jgi:hypothetical protein
VCVCVSPPPLHILLNWHLLLLDLS